MINRAEEDYVKMIFTLQLESELEADDYITTNLLATRLGHSTSSVNEMVKRLFEKGYLDYKRYVGVKLTELGKKEALVMLRKHRLWETFLHDHLKYNWEDIHSEAEVLEHSTSLGLLEALDRFLNSPESCPHGNPIPNEKGEVQVSSTIQLKACVKGEKYVLKRVKDHEGVIRYLNQSNIELGNVFDIFENDPLNQIVFVKLLGRNEVVSIGYGVAVHLYLEKIT